MKTLESRRRTPDGEPMASVPRRRGIHIEIAGLVFRISGATGPMTTWLRDRYAPFLSEKRTTVSVRVEPSRTWPRGRPPREAVDWQGEQLRINLPACRGEADLSAKRIRLSVPPVPAALGPSVFLVLCAALLHRKGGFLLHASGVMCNGRAWVFCGPSESGKTTIARLAEGRPVLSDETVAIGKRNGKHVAFATPFFGEGGPVMGALNTDGPVRGFFFLHKATRFSHQRLTARQATERAFPQVFLPRTDPAVVSGLLGSLADFGTKVPCYDLFFPPRPDLWEYLDGIQ